MKKSKAAKTAKKADKRKFTGKQIGIEFILILISFAFVGLFLSLISFNAADPGWSQTAWHEPIQNYLGPVGAYVSDILLQFVGFIAYSIPFLGLLFCYQLMRYVYRDYDLPINYFSLSLRIIGCLAFVLSAAGFFSLNIRDVEQFQAGGIFGDIVAQEILPLLNHLGASVVLFGISIACITLLTGLSWLFIAEKLGALIVWITQPIFSLFGTLFAKRTSEVSNEDDEQNEQLGIDFVDDDADDQQTKTHSVMSELVNIENNIDDNITEHKSDHAEYTNTDDDIEIKINHQNDEPFLQTTSDDIFNEDVSLEDQSIQANDNIDVIIPTPERLITDDNIAFENHLKVDDNVELQSDTYFIDENNPPPKLLTAQTHQSDKLDINPDYYMPIIKDEDNEYHIEKPHHQHNVVSVSVLNTETDSEDEIEDVIDPVPLTKENIHDSLIHPLLQKSDKPLVKPTTPLPSLNLLTAPPVKQIEVDHSALNVMAKLIEKSLADYRVNAHVVDYLPGPVITRFEIELAPGVKASRISTLDRDIARSLSMPSVRVVEVIPGKPYVGIEIPNKNRQTVFFREVLDSAQFRESKSPLTIVLGKDIAGQSVVADLAKTPHLLVAGTTGSGKSVGVNAMILSILYKSAPEDVRFIMIDPKMLELSVYEGIPHLLAPVVTDMKDAANALNWCVNEMERRYRLMAALGVRNIAGFNDKIKLADEMGRPIPDPLWKPTDSMDLEMPTLTKLPYIVVMVDEFADLIMAVGKKVEELIARLAQKARAAGIHLVLATQRPSVDVITGLIKANIPTRIAFTVSSKIDSRTILDQMGAESLLGMGDMLYLAPNSSIPIRVHGAFVRDEEVHAVALDWKARAAPQYIDNLTSSADDDEDNGFSDSVDEDLDPLFDQVVSFVVEKRRASISSVQRQFRIGYNRAARIVEQMEMQGIVSPPSHNGNREVLSPSPTDY